MLLRGSTTDANSVQNVKDIIQINRRRATAALKQGCNVRSSDMIFRVYQIVEEVV